MRRTALLALPPCLLVACGSEAPTTEAATTTARTTTQAAATPRATPAPTTTAAPTSSALAAAVQSVTPWGSVTYYGQERPTALDAPAPQDANTEWVGIDVEICLNPTEAGGEFNNTAWTVRDAGGGLYDPSSIGYNQFPSPEYPFTGYIGGGECVRGWIVYDVVIGQPLTTVRYLPTSSQVPLGTWDA